MVLRNSRRQDANTLESQNDAQLDELHSKLRSLHAVTIDIHNDSRAQNSILDNTSSTFDSFSSSLTNSANRLGRHVTSQQGQGRTLLYAIGAVFVLFVCYRLFL